MKNSLRVLSVVSLLVTGCAHYSYSRPVLQGTNGVVAYEQTSFNSFLMKGEASKVHTTVKEGDYSRTVSVGSVSGQGDTDMVKALVEAGATAAGVAAKAAAK